MKEVYIALTDHAVKIGASKNPEKRVESLSTSNPYDIKLGLTIDPSEYGVDGLTLEKKLHNIVEPYRMNGEWFDRECLDFLNGFLFGFKMRSVGISDDEQIDRMAKYLAETQNGKL